MEQAKVLKVYRKNSDEKYVKQGGKKYWYSATRSDGTSLTLVFDEGIEVPDKAAFTVCDIQGNPKSKTVEKDGEVYNNVKYYIKSCTFGDMPTEELPL